MLRKELEDKKCALSKLEVIFEDTGKAATLITAVEWFFQEVAENTTSNYLII